MGALDSFPDHDKNDVPPWFIRYLGANTPNLTTLADSTYQAQGGDTLLINKAGGPAVLKLGLPATESGRVTVYNGDGITPTDISARHRQPSVRLSNSGSSLVLPSISAVATANVGWTFGMLVRLNAENAQTGTTHLQFAKIGSGSAYMNLGYEGPNATNPFCIKLLMPNAAATGVVSLRLGTSTTFSPFHTSRLGQWAWIFVRKHDAALTENILRLSDGAEVSVTFTDEQITLGWCPVQASNPTGTVLYAGSTGVTAGTFSAATAAVSVGPDASNTGSFDIAKVFFLSNQCLSAANCGKIATGMRPQDLGLTVVNANDIYYDLDSTTAASLLDLCGGTAASSVTLAGGDALTPITDRGLIYQYMGSTSTTKREIVYSDEQARGM